MVDEVNRGTNPAGDGCVDPIWAAKSTVLVRWALDEMVSIRPEPKYSAVTWTYQWALATADLETEDPQLIQGWFSNGETRIEIVIRSRGAFTPDLVTFSLLFQNSAPFPFDDPGRATDVLLVGEEHIAIGVERLGASEKAAPLRITKVYSTLPIDSLNGVVLLDVVQQLVIAKTRLFEVLNLPPDI
jgi:hypothetical protein